jgi:small subunit ribosomal protein S17
MSDNLTQVPDNIPAPDAGQQADDSSAGLFKRGRRKTRIGKVVSNKMDKSIIVAIERKVMHPLYKKYFKKTTKFMAHDQNNIASIGDIVKIMETRPLSARKRWRLVEIIEKVK